MNNLQARLATLEQRAREQQAQADSEGLLGWWEVIAAAERGEEVPREKLQPWLRELLERWDAEDAAQE